MGWPRKRITHISILPSRLARGRTTTRMSQEEGACIRLLYYCWIHGRIPSDPLDIARRIGKGGSATLATVVAQGFNQDPNDDSRLVYDCLEQERSRQTAWREKKSKAGKASAEVRRSSQLKSTPVQQEAQQTPQQNSTLRSSVFGSHNIETGGAEAPAPSVSNSPEAEPATKAPSPDASQAPVPALRRPVKPEMATWQAKASSIHPDWPVNDIQAAWEYYEKIGWRTRAAPS
jgi:hypothetical protein